MKDTKKIVKMFSVGLLVAGLMGICCTTTSCKSSDNMYVNKTKSSKVVNKNYKVYGNNKKNGSTYRTY